MERRTLLVQFLAGLLKGRCGSAQSRISTLPRPLLHRLVYNPEKPDLVLKLSSGIAILESPPESLEALAVAYQTAVDQDQSEFRSGLKLAVVAVGPLLDQPDRVEPLPMEQHERVFSLSLLHTEVRQRGAQLRKNVVWRPLVAVRLPGQLALGRYRADVMWQARQWLPDGPLNSGPVIASTFFQIRRGGGARQDDTARS